MTPRPGLFKSKERPSSAIYIGSEVPLISPPNLPDLPEPPSPVASVSSRGSGLPSPPATNSTGSGSTGGDIDNEARSTLNARRSRNSMNMLNESNVKTFQDALASSAAQDSRQYRDGHNDDEHDDEPNEGENDEDNTARLDRLLALKSANHDESALQRVRSLTERNRMTLNKITAFSRLSSPSPGPSRHRSPAPAQPPSASSSSSSSHTASSRHSVARSTRPRTSDSSLLHTRSQSYAFDRTPEHLSGSETERESIRDQQESTTSFHTNDPSSSSSQARPQTPPPPTHRIRLTSAPSSPARVRELSTTSRTRTPRKRTSMAMALPDDYDDYADASYSHERESLRGSRAGSRVGQVQQSPRKSGTSSGTRDPPKRHQTRWMSGEVSYADTSHERSDMNDAPLGRRQSLRGGSAESALGLGSGRSLVGEGLRAAGLTRRDLVETPSQRRTARESRELDYEGVARPPSRLSSDGVPARYSDGARPLSRTTRLNGEFRTPDHPSTHERKVATAPRAATSMASYRASLDGGVSRRDNENDDEDEPKTAPLLRAYRSSLGLDTSTRVPSALGNRPHTERYSSPYGGPRRREEGHTTGGSSRDQQAKHAELMKHSLDVFATNLERLGLGEAGRSGAATELVKSAEDIVSAAERLNELIKGGTNRALTEQIDAEVSGNTGDVDLVEVWRSVGGQWRDGLRISDELVRSVTGFLLGVGRVVKDLSLTDGIGKGGVVAGYATGHAGDGAHGRSISLDEDALSRNGLASPEVATTNSSSASGRRSVGSSRRSWEPTPRDRDREREETLQKLAGNSIREPSSRPHSELRQVRTLRESPLPLRGSILNVFNDRREAISTPQRSLGAAPDRHAPAMAPSSSMRRISQPQLGTVPNSNSLETVQGYEPSPTPASRIQASTDRLQPLTHRALTANALNALNNTPDRERNGRAALAPISIPPPLGGLQSEKFLQRNKTIATEKPSTRVERDRVERRHKPAAASTSTIRPQFPVITTTNPTTALTTVTASPESQLFPLSRTDSERSKSSGARSNAAGTFSRPSATSVSSALTGLRDMDQRNRTISNTSIPDELSTPASASNGPSPSAVKAIARAYGPVTPLSGSETERDIRRKTIGTRQGGRPSLDAETGLRSGQSTIMAPPTLPARSGRPRRQTVTALFDEGAIASHRRRQKLQENMVRYSSAALASNPEKTARARGEYLRTHFKNMREVAAAVTGMKLTKAYTYLGDVQEHKRVIPFRRFAGGVGRTGQAKEFKTTQGRWPEKSVKFLLRLLKNAESNADAKNIDVEDLTIKNIVVNQAPKTRRRTYRAHGRINPYQGHPCHVEIILSASDAEVEKSHDKSVIAPLAGLNRRQVARKRIEAARS
ncbi:hypothetical protein ONZ45_g12972 [Pleurotus djamor]|nr:hypothetical protein ONZ45_g12972 [Pleurotus djamor]